MLLIIVEKFGVLIDSYKSKENGLLKKTMTVSFQSV